MKKVCASICARGGSKGVPKKNLRPLCGKPLVGHAVEVAKALPSVERIIVSTDDPEIVSVALHYGAEIPFTRPPELATDTVGRWAVLKHLVNFLYGTGYRPQALLDLDPTTPLRDPAEIQACIDLFFSKAPQAVVTACLTSQNPYFNLVEIEDGYARISKRESMVRNTRQAAPPVYFVGGDVVLDPRELFNYESLLEMERVIVKVVPQIMCVDIDTELDFEIAEFLMSRHRR